MRKVVVLVISGSRAIDLIAILHRLLGDAGLLFVFQHRLEVKGGVEAELV